MRLLGYVWALPVTLGGVTLAAAARLTGGGIRVRSGVLCATGGLLNGLLRGGRLRHGGAALTLGHVILARDEACLARSFAHELIHVRQFERWGLLLLPAYWAVAAWLRFRGRDPYLDHPFEPAPASAAESGDAD